VSLLLATLRGKLVNGVVDSSAVEADAAEAAADAAGRDKDDGDNVNVVLWWADVTHTQLYNAV